MMEYSMLKLFIRDGLDILFVGLNPARGSSKNRHYFSVNASFWNQLHEAGLITESADKMNADEIVFGSTRINVHKYQYGITDLVPEWAESDSRKIKPTDDHCKRLLDDIIRYKPRAVVLIHSKVRDTFLRYVNQTNHKYEFGKHNDHNLPTVLFAIPFPHGSSISNDAKVTLYREVLDCLA